MTESLPLLSFSDDQLKVIVKAFQYAVIILEHSLTVPEFQEQADVIRSRLQTSKELKADFEKMSSTDYVGMFTGRHLGGFCAVVELMHVARFSEPFTREELKTLDDIRDTLLRGINQEIRLTMGQQRVQSYRRPMKG
jgi:hypothetical protein